MALSLIGGQMGAQWNNVLRSYDIRFDIDAKEEPYFVTANAVIRKVRTKQVRTGL